MQAYLTAIGLFEFCCIYIYFPETSQPGTRGIDKMSVSDSWDKAPSKIYFHKSSATQSAIDYELPVQYVAPQVFITSSSQ